MSIRFFSEKILKIKILFGIRGRLILCGLILIVPLMLDRVRLLEERRAQQIRSATTELTELSKHIADSQRDIIVTVEAVLRSSAYLYAAGGDPEQRCKTFHAGMRTDLPWVRSIFIIGPQGTVICSSNPRVLGLNLSDRSYFAQVKASGGFVISDYISSRPSHFSSIVAAYRMSNADIGEGNIIAATIDLQWMSELLNRTPLRPGMSAVLIDGNGVVLASVRSSGDVVGKPIADVSLLSAISAGKFNTAKSFGLVAVRTGGGGKRDVRFMQIAGTRARILVSIDEKVLLGDIDGSIHAAYVQLALLTLFTLLGGWIAGEKLIIRPIGIVTAMADRFGKGDLSTPSASEIKLPGEFRPLVTAFNRMATQLRQREHELIETNDKLMVMASVDMVSGLANRRGLQDQLEVEWREAERSGGSTSMIMIDVDCFKLFNDTYGHLEGDVCLRRIGETLAALAAQTSGFAARFGGEEFCLLLPNTNASAAMEAGERVRAAIETLAIPHSGSSFRCLTISAGVASATPGEANTVQELIAAADIALYVAKHRGRNTVVAHGLIKAEDPQAVSVAG